MKHSKSTSGDRSERESAICRPKTRPQNSLVRSVLTAQAPDLSAVQQRTVSWSAGLADPDRCSRCSALAQAQLSELTCLHCGEQVGEELVFTAEAWGDNGRAHCGLLLVAQLPSAPWSQPTVWSWQSAPTEAGGRGHSHEH